MGVEIERKFLVAADAWRDQADTGRRFCQGHISRDDHASVRIRRSDDAAYITVKGPRSGISRAEFEYAIPEADAEEMLAKLCKTGLVEKTRYRVPYAGMIWEVDVCDGAAAGLVTAEVELAFVGQRIEIPFWIGPEITGDPRFTNASIASWSSDETV
jgi:adenylate cyclase